MQRQGRGKEGRQADSRRRTLAVATVYALLLMMECRTLPGILRARAPAPGLLTSADLFAVATLLQAVLLLSFCVRVARISRQFLLTVCAAQGAAHSRDRRF